MILSLVWLTTDGTADPVWVVGYLLPLEGAARWGLTGAFVGAGLFLGGQVVGEAGTAARASFHTGWPAIAFRSAMAFIVGVVAGTFSASSRRAAAVAEARARQIEEAAARAEAAAALEEQARGEVAAFHAAALTDPDMERLGQTLQTTADAIGAELGCDALGVLVRDRGIAGEVAFNVLGVHGNPGYVRGERLFPVSHPVAAAAMEGQPVLAAPDAVAPMRVRGEVVGALHERADAGPPPDAERVAVLSGLADQLGLVLESARLRADQESTVHRLRELDEMKSDFIAITSHELRTPLSGIRGFVDMLRRRSDEMTEHERDEYLGIVLQPDRSLDPAGRRPADRLARGGRHALAGAGRGRDPPPARAGGARARRGRPVACSSSRDRRAGADRRGPEPPHAGDHEPRPQRHEVLAGGLARSCCGGGLPPRGRSRST